MDDDYLARRGRAVEALLGFRRGARLALIAPRLAFEGVRLAPSGGGVRCRVAGAPALLLRVAGDVHVDVVRLAAGWPRWMCELVTYVGESDACSLVSEPVLLEVMREGDPDRLAQLILEHQIRAENLHLLGEAARSPEVSLGGEPRFELRFEEGTLELAYARTEYERVASAPPLSRAPEVEVRWNGALIELPAGDLRWHPAELAELAVLASTQMDTQPGAVVALFEDVFPDGLPEGTGAIDDGVLRGTLLNLWGVALRNVERLDEAVDTLTTAHAVAREAEPALEQQVAYNLGYAKLQTTMIRRVPTGSRGGVTHFTAHYDADPRHRTTWTECLALFERALELDPSDATARAQVDQTRTLLAMLGANDAAPGKAAPRGRRTTKSDPDAQPKPLPEWVYLAGALVFALLVLAAYQWAQSTRGSDGDAPTPRAAGMEPASPPPPEARDLPRIEALDAFDLAALPGPSDAPCPLAVDLPLEVPRGEVVAPYVARRIGTGELFGTEHFDATVRNWAAQFAPSAEVRPASSAGIGPVTGDGRNLPSVAYGPRAAYRTTVLVTGWRDPVILAGGESLRPGHVEARVIVWSYDEGRFVCAADVEADNRPGLVVVRAPSHDAFAHEDDPLNRARLDLIEQALRAGIPRLSAATTGEPDAGAAAEE